MSNAARIPQPPGPVPKSLSGFESIEKYWDPLHSTFAAKILPGEFYVTANPQEMIVTVLGSCVSACIRDPLTGIGGMNHFMLPREKNAAGRAGGNAERYGLHAMESLINAIASRGHKDRNQLEVKLTGGGKVLQMGLDIGAQNIAFVREYALAERLDVRAEDLGGDHPRKVYYFPETGMLRVRKLKELGNDTIVDRERHYAATLDETPTAGDVELFE